MRRPRPWPTPMFAVACSVAALLSGGADPASAQAGYGVVPGPGNGSVSAFVANTKLQRGLRQGDADVVLGLDLAWRGDTGWAIAGGLAGPTWHGSYTSTEVNLALSRSGAFEVLGEGWRWQLGAARYEYIASRDSRRIARDRGYTELSLGFSWRERLSLSLAALPETRGYGMRWRGSRGLGRVAEVAWSQRIAGATSLEIGLGHFDLSGVQGQRYSYGHVGLAGDLGPVRWHLARVGSDAVARGVTGPQVGGGRWLATVSWTR